MQLTTNRFLLRDFVDADLPAFAAYHADPRSTELYGPDETNPVLAAELIELFRTWAFETPRLNYQLAIIRRGGTLVGCCGLRGKGAEPGRAELGVELAPEYWGRYGYALEVMKRLANFGFSDLELTEIYGSTVSANAKVARLAGSLGAVSVERPTPDWMVARGWRQIEWQISREQWQAGLSNNSIKPNPLRRSV
ncbi:GNAT family N-acetyltransferase [Pistricoccus aurantiacus]|uniref:GNAT family N-acetyltransferase n=1 Tax=Pistricoccus aurantiacus TaxID=1883414 RepID=A0A5B8SUE0_9GAMM|nr:GNAT family N-acetyltransferase [Pistricoccus aurantiacus]QEA39637.1 GNAT family N-acetyltransferase [Pistricoccus aurantiacus]